MAYDFQLLGLCFAILTALALLVRNERPLRRWLLGSRRRRRKRAFRQPVLS